MTVRRHSTDKPMLGLAAFFAGLIAAAPNAAAEDVRIPLDQVRILSFNTPVKTVFVGNPVIADITVIDSTHVFLLGKNFGTTNLIALDEKGRETVNEEITVLERPGSAVTLQRGAARTTLFCSTSRCEAAPTPGDDNAPFDAVNGQIDKREALSLKAAGAQ